MGAKLFLGIFLASSLVPCFHISSGFSYLVIMGFYCAHPDNPTQGDVVSKCDTRKSSFVLVHDSDKAFKIPEVSPFGMNVMTSSLSS